MPSLKDPVHPLPAIPRAFVSPCGLVLRCKTLSRLISTAILLPFRNGWYSQLLSMRIGVHISFLGELRLVITAGSG